MGKDFDLSWQTVGPQVGSVLQQAQAQSAISAVDYFIAEGEEVGLEPELAGLVNVAAFVGVTDTGADITSAARGAVIEAKTSIAAGIAVEQALTAGEKWLTRFAMNQVTAASSDAVSTAVAASPTTTGFVRMLNPPSCKECIILAGKWFRWNEGFQRHPGCDCRHVPARESMDEFRTNPYTYFTRLSRSEQDKLFGAEDAQAIRDGADIYRVVNVRNRGAASQSWQQRRYDSPTVTIDDILKQADGDRARAIALMKEHGFILEQGQTAGGALNGNAGGSFWGYSAGAMGRGGARRGAADAFRRADATGVRDTLNPATQTAAERRFHQAYLAHEAALAGRNPFSSNRPLSQQERDLIEKQWQKQLKLATSSNTSNAASSQVKALAAKLGVI